MLPAYFKATCAHLPDGAQVNGICWQLSVFAVYMQQHDAADYSSRGRLVCTRALCSVSMPTMTFHWQRRLTCLASTDKYRLSWLLTSLVPVLSKAQKADKCFSSKFNSSSHLNSFDFSRSDLKAVMSTFCTLRYQRGILDRCRFHHQEIPQMSPSDGQGYFHHWFQHCPPGLAQCQWRHLNPEYFRLQLCLHDHAVLDCKSLNGILNFQCTVFTWTVSVPTEKS